MSLSACTTARKLSTVTVELWRSRSPVTVTFAVFIVTTIPPSRKVATFPTNTYPLYASGNASPPRPWLVVLVVHPQTVLGKCYSNCSDNSTLSLPGFFRSCCTQVWGGGLACNKFSGAAPLVALKKARDGAGRGVPENGDRFGWTLDGGQGCAFSGFWGP